ncbi:MAG: hypothetical protein COX43_03355 [Parcubacteria group bacterium CG23_combo_of_CG06-09_8_20_14_all_35_9]|nr:MAG: hypothetical protein COX43_03355 [Parcubacteria group bacterium CG23_combo_of_CG06-09_8_20_14_all_35_9]
MSKTKKIRRSIRRYGNKVIDYKVLHFNLTSVGLLGTTKMQYRFDVWNRPLEPLSDHPRKGGGLWVVRKKSDAKQIRKYLFSKHHIVVRIFACQIGEIIYETSYRVKTDGVFFTREDEIKKRGEENERMGKGGRNT